MKKVSLLCFMFCTTLTAQQADYERAWAAYTSGRYEEAFMAIEQCVALDTGNYRYLFLKGKSLENLYRYGEAIAAQQKALKINPDGMEAQAALASLYLISGQPEESTRFYERLAAAEPQVNRWKMSWATALLAAGQPQSALEQFKTVVETDSANWLVYKYMGDCFFRLNDYYPSFHNYYTALTLYPNNKTLWGTLTRLLVTHDHTAGAIEVGNEAVAIDSTNVEVWKYLGVAYYKTGETRPAYQALQKALALGDSSFTTFSHYGILNYHIAQNRMGVQYFRDAEKYLEKALQLNPNDINTMNYLATTYGYTGKDQKGLDIFVDIDKRIAEFDSIGMKANIQRGHLLRNLRRNQEAANAFITAIKDFPKDIENIFHVATCYDRASNRKLAIDWYTRYLEKIDPRWATKQWTKQELNKYELAEYAMNRIKSLREDMFWEGEK